MKEVKLRELVSRHRELVILALCFIVSSMGFVLLRGEGKQLESFLQVDEEPCFKGH